jgi:hypothetical protein
LHAILIPYLAAKSKLNLQPTAWDIDLHSSYKAIAISIYQTTIFSTH